MDNKKIKVRVRLAKACIREVREEADANFTFKKILFVRDFIPDDEPDEHSVELFILGDIDKFEDIHGKNDDLATVETHLEWVDLEKLKEINTCWENKIMLPSSRITINNSGFEIRTNKSIDNILQVFQDFNYALLIRQRLETIKNFQHQYAIVENGGDYCGKN